MNKCLVVVLFWCAGCGVHPTAPQRVAPSIRVVGETSALLTQLQDTLSAQLSPSLGWIEYQRTWEVRYPDGITLVCIPMEAEDEIRTLALCFSSCRFTGATCIGLAETSWFSASRAETLATYEGWLFLYGLGDGERHIASYFEAGTLLEHDVDFPEQALAFDLLGSDVRFSWLALTTAAPPVGITPRVFLTEGERRMRMIADVSRSMFRCASL